MGRLGNQTRGEAMPRQNKSPVYPVALSPARMAQALSIRADQITDAIRRGELPVYQLGVKRRVLVRDAARWIRRTWK
jgi:hypothetical protein